LQGQALIPPAEEAKLRLAAKKLVEELDPQAWRGPGYLDFAKQQELAFKWIRRAFVQGVLSPHKDYVPEEQDA
jgi:hypothetical protein